MRETMVIYIIICMQMQKILQWGIIHISLLWKDGKVARDIIETS